MKSTLKVVLLASSLVCCSAYAGADYEAECSAAACVPFNTSNSYVVQFAVTTAQNNHAVIGDEIAIYRQTLGRCQTTVLVWEVIDVPVLNSSDLDHIESDCLN